MNIRTLFGFLFYSHAPVVICLVGLLVVYLFARGLWKKEWKAKLLAASERLLPIGSWSMILAIFGLVLLNAVFPAFVWVGESQPASVSYLLLKGFPLYHTAASAERYSLLYGPVMYLATASVYRLFGASIFTAKLVTTVLLLGMCIWAALIAARRTTRPALALAAYFAALLPLIFSSPLLTLSTTAAYSIYYFSSSRLRSLAIGVCVGLACGVKIHAGVYFLPIFVDLVLRRRLLDLLILGVAGAVTTGAPFLIPGIDVRNYYFWLHSAAEHGLLWRLFGYQSEWFLYEVSVVAAALFLVMRQTSGQAWETLFPPLVRDAAAGAILLVMIVASKAGSGFHHLLPLVPCYLIVLLPLVSRVASQIESAGRSAAARAIASAYLVLILAFNGISVAHIYSQVLRVPALAIQRDLNRITREHPGARVVVGDAESTPGEWQDKPGERGRFSEPLLLFEGHPFLYDAVALMDMDKSGLPIPEATVKRLRDGSIDLWLFPKGREPFNIVNWYDYKTPVFSPEFRQAFFANYERDGSSEFYDLWAFRRR